MRTTTRTLTRLALTAALILGPLQAGGGSIWARSQRGSRSHYVDDKAHQVGDVLTIVINEQSSLESGTTRTMEKKDDRTASVTGGAKLDILRGIDAATGQLFNLPELDVTTKGETKFDGSAEFEDSRSMVDQITVLVEDVLPNGNMVVLGKRTRTVHGETEIIQVSGMVRPSDVSFDNDVTSTRVANFHIVYKHEGRENRFSKPGWLSQILNFLNPF